MPKNVADNAVLDAKSTPATRSDPSDGSLPVTVVQPSRGWAALGLAELWEFREVLYFLIWKDIKVRYRQTLIGATWAIIQPLLTMVVFSIFFGRLAKMPSDGLPYPLFAFSALVPWTFFARGLALSAASLVASSHLITKVYFPRLLLPIARVVSGFPDLALSLLVLLGMIWWYGQLPGVLSLLWIPALVLLALVSALGVGFWLSALNVQYRDVQHAVPFMIQLGLFLTPIAYPSSLLSEPWRTLVRFESDGRRRRGVPLGASRQWSGAGLDYRGVRPRRGDDPRNGSVLLQARRTDLCGRGMTAVLHSCHDR